MANDILVINAERVPALSYKGNLDVCGIRIGKGVKEIGVEAFSMCPNLRSIEVDAENDRYTSGGANAIIDKASGVLLVGCQTTVIPECVTEIGAFAFCGQTQIEKVRIPSNVKKVAERAFYGCTGVTEIVFEEGVTSLEAHCFEGSVNLETLHVPLSMPFDEFTAFGVKVIVDTTDDGYAIEFEGGPEKLTKIYYAGTKAQYQSFQGQMDACLNYLWRASGVTVECADGVYCEKDLPEPTDEAWVNGWF